MIPASIAASLGRTPSAGVRAVAAPGVVVAEVGAGRHLDAVGALAEVNGVQVLGQDLVLVPLALEVVGERGLAQLLEIGTIALCLERVLDELQRDRRGALGRAAGNDVRQDGSADAHEVDAAVLVEALVLDRDHRLLHVGRDVSGVRPGRRWVLLSRVADLAALGVETPRCSWPRRTPAWSRGPAVLRDGHHHSEERRDHREGAEAHEDDHDAELLDPARLGLARGGAS